MVNFFLILIFEGRERWPAPMVSPASPTSRQSSPGAQVPSLMPTARGGVHSPEKGLGEPCVGFELNRQGKVELSLLPTIIVGLLHLAFLNFKSELPNGETGKVIIQSRAVVTAFRKRKGQSNSI